VTRQRVTRTDALSQPARDLHEHFVADVVPEHVVDLLEAVEVHEERRHPGVPACPHDQRVLDTVTQQPPVGQPRQRVIQRRLTQLLLQLPLLGDVLNAEHPANQRARIISQQ